MIPNLSSNVRSLVPILIAASLALMACSSKSGGRGGLEAGGSLGSGGNASTGGGSSAGSGGAVAASTGGAGVGGSALVTGGTVGSGGTSAGGGATSAMGGAALGGAQETGGALVTGGTSSGGMAAGGQATGGGMATGGSGSGGTSGAAGGAGDYWGGLGNPPAESAGCGRASTITTGKKTIISGGIEREYIIDVPADYDPNEPYRLFYASHGLGGMAEHVADWWHYFGLKDQADAAGVSAIFIAPQAIDAWNESDHGLFDDITDFVKDSLCVDTSRVFVTGMSFGGMITYSLSTNHQQQFRAGVAMAPANFNIWLPDPRENEPIAWMQTTGMGDTTCPWDLGDGRGSKYIALEKAADNGCTVPADIETWDSSDPTRHICVDLENCRSGYPVKVCTFDGGHWQFPSDEMAVEDQATSWVPVESWEFFMQF